jgi:DNA-binding transcriptional MerR regulator
LLICESETTESGHRLYDAAVFARLERIKRLRQKGKGLQEIARLLDKRKKQKSEDDKAGGLSE